MHNAESKIINCMYFTMQDMLKVCQIKMTLTIPKF